MSEREGTEMKTKIRTAYQTIAPHRGAWIRIADLHQALSDLPAAQVNATIDAMFPEAEVQPESNQKALRPADLEARLWSGGMWCHLVKIS